MTSKPLRADAKRNRDAIVSAARAAFAVDQADIRFDDFADLAGVGTGTLYRHFPTRADLAAAVYLVEATALCDLAREKGDTLPAADALEAFLRSFVAYLDENKGLARALTAATGAQALVEGGMALEAEVRRLVEGAVATGAFRADAEAGAVLVAMHGIAGTLGRPRWRAEAEGVVSLLSDGRRGTPSPRR